MRQKYHVRPLHPIIFPITHLSPHRVRIHLYTSFHFLQVEKTVLDETLMKPKGKMFASLGAAVLGITVGCAFLYYSVPLSHEVISSHRSCIGQFRSSRTDQSASSLFDDGLAKRLYQEVEIYVTNPQYDTWQKLAADEHNIDWLLGKAVRIKESHDDPLYVSSVGAAGLMQLMPREGSWVDNINYQNYLQARGKSRTVSERIHKGKTYLDWGEAYQNDLFEKIENVPHEELIRIDQRFDPEYNIFEGTRELARNIARLEKIFDGETILLDGLEYPKKTVLAVAAYNAGLGNVMDGKIPANVQTSTYVKEVFSIYTLMKEKERKQD